MSDPIDTDAWRAEHIDWMGSCGAEGCASYWPCPTLALLDEIDRLHDVIAAMDDEVAKLHADLLATTPEDTE